MALIAHQPPTTDAVMALWYTFAGLGVGAQDALQALTAASAAGDQESRKHLAELAEASLLIDRRLIPLIRLEGWLAWREGLAGVKVGPAGILHLEEAWWKP
jgi:hypothetical protein